MTAYELPDGRLLVPKVAEGENGELGDGMVPVGPGDEDYEAWRAYYEASGETPEPAEDAGGEP